MRESAEKYLITILILRKKIKKVRSIDVAKELLVSKASVSNAIKMLRCERLVYMDKEHNLTLTEDGLRCVTAVFERYKTIESFLTDMLYIDKEPTLDSSPI